MINTAMQDLLSSFFDYQLKGINVAIPAVVVDVSRLTESVIAVQPCINEMDRVGNTTPWPQIMDVPVVFPSSSTSALTFPISKNDSVLLVFSMRGLDNFKNSNSLLTNPTDYRALDIRDAIAIPCVWPRGKSKNNPATRSTPHNVNNLSLVHNIGTAAEAGISIDTSGGVTIRGTSFNVITETTNITSSTMNVAVGTTNWSGAIYGTGELVFNGINYTTHGHTGVENGNSTSGPPV